MPDLSDEQADFLRRYIEDGFGVGDDSEGLAALLLESAFGNRLCGKLGVQPEDGEENDWWPGTGLHWDDGATGRMLVLRAAEHRHIWDGLRTRLQEQLETGEDPPKWLLTWAAEAFTGLRQSPSGPGSGRGRAAPARAAAQRAAEAVETLRLMGFTAEAAQTSIAENPPDRWKDRDVLAKALLRSPRRTWSIEEGRPGERFLLSLVQAFNLCATDLARNAASKLRLTRGASIKAPPDGSLCRCQGFGII